MIWIKRDVTSFKEKKGISTRKKKMTAKYDIIKITHWLIYIGRIDNKFNDRWKK